MEIEITSKYLVTSLSAQNHLHTHGFDFTTQEIHRGACSNGGNVVGLEMVDDFGNGIQTFLNCEDIFMMDSLQIIGSVSCSKKIGRILEADGE
jgi:hypothetical protein